MTTRKTVKPPILGRVVVDVGGLVPFHYKNATAAPVGNDRDHVIVREYEVGTDAEGRQTIRLLPVRVTFHRSPLKWTWEPNR